MTAQHLILLVEEPSMEAFLRAALPRLMPANRSFEVYAFQGKQDLLGKLQARLRACAQWMPEDWRLVVVVDRDDDDCLALKRRFEATAATAGLRKVEAARAIGLHVDPGRSRSTSFTRFYAAIAEASRDGA